MTIDEFYKSKIMAATKDKIKNFTFKIPANEIEVKFLNRLILSITDKQGELLSPVKSKQQNVEVIDDITGLIDIGGKANRATVFTEKFNTQKAEVIIYFPAQFEALRGKSKISLKSLISSFSIGNKWDDNTGGKTGANFFKTYDHRFVFKVIEKKEFGMLLGFAP
mmetsp:Transcript_24911/g.22064  ORF Transcript_24911/g.22064 Transcript_24911/m.22064 type:complete len:165 (+) Transcript_24911:1533-2027(+)